MNKVEFALRNLENAIQSMETQLKKIKRELAVVQRQQAALERDKAKAAEDKNQAALLDLLIQKLGLKNDAALCRVLGVDPPLISRIRRDKLPIGAALLVRMHEVSGISTKEMKQYIKEYQTD